jgi:hypothetical protein
MSKDRDNRGQFTQGNEARPEAPNARHGVYGYRDRNRLPARLPQDFDQALAAELLEHVGGNPAFRILAESAARRATILEVAYSWLAAQDVKPFWLERDGEGRAVVKWQPVLRFIGSYHEGLRRDLAELGLTPQSRAKLGLPEDSSVLDAAIKAAKDVKRSTGGTESEK